MAADETCTRAIEEPVHLDTGWISGIAGTKNSDGRIRTSNTGNQTGVEMNWLLDGRRRDMYQGHRGASSSRHRLDFRYCWYEKLGRPHSYQQYRKSNRCRDELAPRWPPTRHVPGPSRSQFISTPVGFPVLLVRKTRTAAFVPAIPEIKPVSR